MIIRKGDAADGFSIDTEAGGRLKSVVMAGSERLLTEPADGGDSPIAWGCYVMAPFHGRVRFGKVSWRGYTVSLPLNDPPHALHGAVFDRPWQVTAQTADSVSLVCAFDPARWPFRGSVTQHIAIASGRLELTAEILADEPMPAAIGWHPWFRKDGADLRVKVKSDSTLRLLSDLIPTGDVDRVDERTDLRAGLPIGSRRLDDAYVAVKSPMLVDWPDLELEIAFEKPVGVAVVYHHRDAVCVEPATAWPDSIRLAEAGRTDTGLVELAAGERLRASTIWTWRKR